MDTYRDRARSDRSRERAQRRKKNRGAGDAVRGENNDPRGNYHDQGFVDVAYPSEHGEVYRDVDYSDNYHQDQLDDGEFEHQHSPDDDYVPQRRHKKKSKRSSSKPTTIEDKEYVNAPYRPEEDYPRKDDDLAYDDPEYDDQQYDDDGYQVESQENYPEPEDSVFSGSQRIPIPATRSHRSSKPIPRNGKIPPSVDSLSDYGRQSAAAETPRAVGGEEHGFWNPEVDVGTGRQPSLSEQPPFTGLQKFIASFRRLRRPKAPNAKALTEQNVSNSGTLVLARVIMLDGEEISFQLDRNDTGQSLFSRVCQHADIVETDYFGLTYVSNKLRTWFWLDPEKKINKQLRNGEQWLFSFQVKFYAPEPTLLQEDITRYQLALQVRQDIYTGKLPCSWVTQALLGSFMVQAELGDYDEREHGGSTDYLKEFEFVPSPTPQLLQKIAELHKTHVGMKPNQADIKYLETAKRLELYGVDLHPVRDTENVEIYLGVGFHGIVIYRDRLRIGRFAWPKVLRISYKKNNFYLKIRPDNRHAGSTGHLYSNLPRSGMRDTYDQMSQQRRTSVADRTPSYASPQGSYMDGSRSHEYVNQAKFLRNGPVEQGSIMSGSVMSDYSAKYSQNEIASRRTASPQYPTARKSAGYGYEAPSEVSQSTGYQNKPSHSSRRRPSGGVPALGGIMLTDPMPRRDNPQVKTRDRKEPPRHNAAFEEPDEPVDASLEYDDEDELEEDDRHFDYPPHSPDGRYGPQSRLASRTPPMPTNAGRTRASEQSKPPTRHTHIQLKMLQSATT
ncbi:hypothetical protein T265_01846 [Opisthorchis viverrini]|uniref:FERM domain-containing protein n=1 Tax=Opisthorchis viverrini TaxID=6198 RepID=A0A074ZX84_OPIVI|nr:hypothetical protein T265_01846 [Opisthorchis viverrini]KER32073.1 hypothetical protein T265_01846 [Opisthorchis viverrini]